MSDCSVCIGGDCDYYFDTVIDVQCDSDTAICCECRKLIGEGAECVRGDRDGESSEYTCLICAEIRSTYSCGGVELWGSLWEEMADQADEIKMAGKCWDDLSAAAKAKLLENWRKWKGIDS